MLSILKKLRGKNFFDIYLRGKRIIYQKKVLKNNNLRYYSDAYLVNNVKEKDIDTLIYNFTNVNNFLFDSFDSKQMLSFDIEIVKSAEEILKHKFDLLGSGLVSLNYGEVYEGLENNMYKDETLLITPKTSLLPKDYAPINWLVDFKSGYQWNTNIFYSKVREVSSKIGVDIKVPWELSRCQHFGILGAAYQMTKDIKYAKEIRNQIIDWINNNPYCYGPNWACAMDVGIRAANWLMAYDLIKESGVFDHSSIKLILKSILHHTKYLENNLEWTSKLTSNHYLSDIAGLLFISKYFKSYKKSYKVEKFAIAELEKEIYKQTYDDGMNSEGSTSYHRLVLEIFAYCYLLDRKTTSRLTLNYKKRLEKMFEFSRLTMKSDGTITQIGDNDSGVFFRFKDRAILDHSYLLLLENAVLGRFIENQELVIKDPELELLKFLEEKDIYKIKNKTSSVFNKSGFYVYKSRDLYLTIYNGPNGQKGNGGHAHNDKLSFTLNIKGEDVFVDPGTYLYTPIPERRNEFRSTSSHNTVVVDNKEQNQFIKGYLFGLIENCTKVSNDFNFNEDGFNYKGSHNGYVRYDEKLIHIRKINFSKSKGIIKILDFFRDDKYSKKAYFIIKKEQIKSITDHKISLKIGEVLFEGAIDCVSEDYVYSKAYGEKNTNDFCRIEVCFKKELNTIIKLNK